jgi:hypothetical protein
MREINPIRNQVLLENEKIAIKAISGNIFWIKIRTICISNNANLRYVKEGG